MARPNLLPAEPFSGSLSGNNESVDWALAWTTDGGQSVTESYVNLIPTPQGGTHVNGLRTGLTNAVREFADFRSLLAARRRDRTRGCLGRPEFRAQRKTRRSTVLRANEGTPLIARVGCVCHGRHQDSFSLWLNQHPETGDQIATLAIGKAQKRLKAAKKVVRKKIVSGPALPASSPTAPRRNPSSARSFLSRVIRQVARPNRRAIATRRRSCRSAARS